MNEEQNKELREKFRRVFSTQDGQDILDHLRKKYPVRRLAHDPVSTTISVCENAVVEYIDGMRK